MTDPTPAPFPSVPESALDAAPESQGDDEFISTGDGRFRIAFTTRAGQRVAFTTRRMRVGDLWRLSDLLVDVQEAEAADERELAAANKAAQDAHDEAGLPPRWVEVGGRRVNLPVVDSRKATEIRRRREERIARYLLEEALPACSPAGSLDGVDVADLPAWWPGMLGPLNDAWRYLPTLPGSG